MNKLRLILLVGAIALVSLTATAAPLWPDRKAPIVAEGVNGLTEDEATEQRALLRQAYGGQALAFYRAGEFQVDIFGSASVAELGSVDDLNDHEAGGGLGVTYFFTRNFGLGYEVRGNARTIKSDFLNEGGVSAFWRFPIGTVAPYGVAGVGYEIVDRELRGNVYAGAGLEVRISPRVGVFTEVRRVWEGPKKYDARAGLRFAF